MAQTIQEPEFELFAKAAEPGFEGFVGLAGFVRERLERDFIALGE